MFDCYVKKESRELKKISIPSSYKIFKFFRGIVDTKDLWHDWKIGTCAINRLSTLLINKKVDWIFELIKFRYKYSPCEWPGDGDFEDLFRGISAMKKENFINNLCEYTKCEPSHASTSKIKFLPFPKREMKKIFVYVKYWIHHIWPSDVPFSLSFNL